MTDPDAGSRHPPTRQRVEADVIHLPLPPHREPTWIRSDGTIEGLHAIRYKARADMQHDLAVARLACELDGEAWLAQNGLSGISVIVEFTEGGTNHVGRPVRTPSRVAHSRVAPDGVVNVSSYVPLELVGPLTEHERARFWFDWYAEIVAVLGRRRKLGMPGPRPEADVAAMMAEVSAVLDDGTGEDADAPLTIEVHVPIGARRTRPSSEPTWMRKVPELLASLDGPVLLDRVDSSDADHYVFRLTGTEASLVMLAATQIAALPGVPGGAFALFLDGAGAPDPSFQLPLAPPTD